MKTDFSFYLFAVPTATPDESSGTVFYQIEGESLAESLCGLFRREYANANGLPVFRLKAAASISAEDQVLLDEALDWLDVYDDPDPGVYDPPPSNETLLRAQYGDRARKWEELLRKRIKAGDQNSSQLNHDTVEAHPPTNELTEMSAEARRNSALILLMLLAQAYYKVLESAISMASWVAAVDLELNQSYLWTTTNITNLLKHDEDLKDFPAAFEPLFPDLYPSTIRDVEWDDMVAPDAERFLSTVQQYVHSKGTYEPEEGSPGWIFIEMFRPGVTTAIERATAYNKRMHQHLQRVLGSSSQARPEVSAGVPQASTAASETTAKEKNHRTKPIMPTVKRNKVFISYSHKDAKFLEELILHLKPLERAGLVSKWSDKQIAPGSQWFDEIKGALVEAKVAVMMVSPGFLASDFIHEHELGPLLKEAEQGGLRILWIPVRACSYKETPLKNYQAVISPDKPLAEMKAERDKAWVKICEEIKNALNPK